MKVEVQLINEKGRPVAAAERKALRKYRGVLRLHEERVHDLGRAVVTANLISQTDGTDSTLLPTLHDASLLFVRDQQMRIRGFELLDGVQYGQTWDVKVA